MKKHNKTGKGFDVSPEQLAHDLAIVMLMKDKSITSSSDKSIVYSAYTENLDQFTALIEDKIRPDGLFKG